MFICLEGCDACGKATQSRLLAEEIGATLYSFPDYNTPMGKLVKGHLKRYWQCAEGPGSEGVTVDLPELRLVDAKVFQALQLANRMEHAVDIAHAVAMGWHVVADRYWPSGVVYGGADGIDTTYLRALHAHLPQPDLYLLLDVDPGDSVRRRPDRRDRYETQAGLMEQVVHRYRALWREMGYAQGHNRWVVINGRGPVETVRAAVREAVRRMA